MSHLVQASDNKNPLENIEALGLEVLGGDPPIEFTLEDLAGNKKSLADYRGQWVWLVFWATWCSVCKGEMPTLESLYQEFKDKNLTVLGISVDQDKNALKSYIQENSITFPILHDFSNKVASQYKASGVPTVYLLSPDGKLVGLARGALNWERKDVLARVKDLIKSKKIPTFEGDGLSATKLLPPKLEIIPPESFATGQWLPFEVHVKWPGPSSMYLIKVPKLEIPEGVQVGKISSSSESSGGHSILNYHFPIFFKEQGSFKIGPVDLSYRSRQSQLASDQTTRNPGMTVKIAKPSFPLWILVSVATLVFLFIVTFVIRKRFRSKGLDHKGSNKNETIESWSSLLQQAKKHKVEGKTKEYCLELFSVCWQIRRKHPHIESRRHDVEMLDRVESLLEGIRYGGKLPQESEISRMEKIVEWSLNEESWEELSTFESNSNKKEMKQ